jgi:Lar family restriction alleviation protein
MSRISPVSETLKPCPFCGGKNIEIIDVEEGPQAGCRLVECYECFATTGGKLAGSTQDSDLIHAWNTRSSDLAQCSDQWQPIETAPEDHLPVQIYGIYGQLVAFRDVNWIWWSFPNGEDPLNYTPTHWKPLGPNPSDTPTASAAQNPSNAEATVSRIMVIRNGMILDGDAEALIRKEIGALRTGALDALILAEDTLSRSPFSTMIWPNDVHPQTGITKIRDAIKSLEDSSTILKSETGK